MDTSVYTSIESSSIAEQMVSLNEEFTTRASIASENTLESKPSQLIFDMPTCVLTTGVRVGFGVGSGDGAGLVGAGLGDGVGTDVGTGTGSIVGAGTGSVVGMGTGSIVGAGVGAGTGSAVGLPGRTVGMGTGSMVGTGVVGVDVGAGSGVEVGVGSGIDVGMGSGIDVGEGSVGSGVGASDQINPSMTPKSYETSENEVELYEYDDSIATPP